MKWRRIIVLTLVMSIALGMGGCALLSPDELTEAQMRTWGIEYLEDRYDREFEVTGLIWGGVFSNHLNGFYAKTPDYPYRDKIAVDWSQGGIKGKFNDRFLYSPMSDEYQKQIEPIVLRYFPQNHTTASVYGPYYPSSFNSETTFDEFSTWARSEARVGTVVAVHSVTTEEFDERVTLLEMELREFSDIGSLSISLLSQDSYQIWQETYPDGFDGHHPEIERIKLTILEWGDQ